MEKKTAFLFRQNDKVREEKGLRTDMLLLTYLSVDPASVHLNHYICGAVPTKCHHCPLAIVVSKTLPTFPSVIFTLFP